MGRKHFQDLANVLCQKFVECPSNLDLVDLAILGDGLLELFITDDRATHAGHAIEPLAFAPGWMTWAEGRLEALGIPRAELRSAVLQVDYKVALSRSPSLGWLTARFEFQCTGIVSAVDRDYRAELRAERNWGLSQVSPSRLARHGR